MRSRQHLQKHFVGNATCRAAGALPVKPSFRARLGMCQPASPRGNTLRLNARFHSPACAALTRSAPFQIHLRQLASPCSLSTLLNAPPLLLPQTDPNEGITRPPSPAIQETLTGTKEGRFRATYLPPKAGRVNAVLGVFINTSPARLVCGFRFLLLLYLKRYLLPKSRQQNRQSPGTQPRFAAAHPKAGQGFQSFR